MAVDEVDAAGADRDDVSQLSDRTNNPAIDERGAGPSVEQTNKRSRSEQLIPGATNIPQSIVCFKVPLLMAHDDINSIIATAPGDVDS